MKHLFYIHSQTCTITALKIIQDQNLDISNVIFLISRNTPNLDNRIKHINIYPLVDLWNYFNIRSLFNFRWIYNNRILNILDSLIERVAPNGFVFYSQNGRHYKYNIFISHPLCKGNHYIEDGLDMYTSKIEYNKKYPNPLKKRYKIVNNILGFIQGNKNRIFQKSDPFWKANYGTCFFALHEESMKDISLKIPIINLQKVNLKFQEKKLKPIPILLPSALSEQGICSNRELSLTYIRFCVNSNIKEAYIKWHPAHTNESKSEIKSLLRTSGITLIELEKTLSLELYFMHTSTKHKIVSIGSSLLIYGALFGKNCVSFALYPILHIIINGYTPRSKYWLNTYPKFTNDKLILFDGDIVKF